ncbi:MAG: TDT family transporter [Propionibacteriaceae bacterium]|nr:TDT family transporter [Propionibacteriaceae bacterium]
MTEPLNAGPITTRRSGTNSGSLPDHHLARWGILRDLEHPGQLIAAITPNWYASIMGTGVVAVAAATLPEQFPGLRFGATVVWAVAAFLLVALTVVTILHWCYHYTTAREYILDPVMAHYYGAPPMAMLTVGTGTLLLGRDWIGLTAALSIDWVLWFAGTAAGLLSAVVVPYVMFTAHAVKEKDAFGGWLMPVVPPMVSAASGALLLPYTPPGQARLAMLACCYAMFGLSLLASIMVITLVWNRLVLHKVGSARMVPTLWIILGPLGQSITVANLLGGNAHLAIDAPYSSAMQAFGVMYGLLVWGFALLWIALAMAITVRTIKKHLPFSLTWWSFTFPIGTYVTGTTGLASHTGLGLFRVTAAVLYACLVGAWVLVAARTTHGTIRGRLFLPAAQASQPPTEQPALAVAHHNPTTTM